MPLVTVGLGVTVKFGDPFGNNYFKTNVEIRDLDTELDIEEQLTAASKVINTTLNYMHAKIDKELDERINKSRIIDK